MSTLKVNEIDSKTGSTITVTAGTTLAGTDIIGATQIAANAVTTAKILDDNITTAKILDDNITTAKILDNNVTLAKLSDGTQGGTIYYGASGAPTELAAGTSGQFLQTAGASANPVWGTVASSGFNTVTTFAAGSTSGWSPASGTTQIIVEIQAGGAGGGGSSASAGGGHGGGGAFAWKRLTVVDTDTMDIVVGAAGTAGTGGVTGGTGGTSSFTSASGTSFTAITCVGGSGGGGGVGGTTGTGGVGGTVTSAAASYDFRMDGTNGRNGGENPGGGSLWGLGQVKTVGLGTAQVGVGYGAGAQGYSTSGTAGGAAGQAGLVVIWEYK